MRGRNRARGLHFSQLNEELLDNPKMQEVRDQIQEVKQMKEKLNYVYFNKQWKEWRREFAKAEEFKTMGDAEFDNCIDDVLQFIDDSEKQRTKINLYKKLVRNDAQLTEELTLFDDIRPTLDSNDPPRPADPPRLIELARAGAVRRNPAMGRREGAFRHTLLRVEE